MNVVSEPLEKVVDKIGEQIDSQGDPLAAIIRGVEEMWDVSLLKFTYELTNKSVYTNVTEIERRGLLHIDGQGIPADARNNIEELLEKTRRDSAYAPILITELKRWGLFQEYQDRFFSLFRQ